ncbi:hypothetical protein [uncultured Corynebacterium sp.]|uniref:hypothetical protein n=1 Tax=uncultured Corynebacterium sp. TaxID=159447 RepID=UPI00259396A4|nr:hypothetical protein [uncultured Corynebacterium sp.]
MTNPTTNIDRAADIIYDTLSGQYGDFCIPTDAAEALADAGLIAPDLPEPDDPSIFVPGGKGWLPGGPDGPSVWTAPGGTVMVQRIEPGDLTPDEAREVAHALLAAANHAETSKETNE